MRVVPPSATDPARTGVLERLPEPREWYPRPVHEITETGPVAFGNGRFALRAALGTTPTGGVFLAEDRKTHRRCAVKLLDISATSKETAARFLAEARVLQAVEHPHIVHAWAQGQEGGFVWYAMDRLPASLRDHAKRKGPMPAALATAATMQVLSGLDAVHQKGLIHRDVKLTNVLVSDEGVVRIADFGVAHHPRGTVPFETNPGQGFGTVGYGAPEQWDGSNPVGPAADVFATGVLLYRLMTGRRPDRLHMAHHRRDLLDGLPEPIKLVLITATQVELEARYPTARTMAEALAQARNAITRNHEATAWVQHLGNPTGITGPGWDALTDWFRR